MFVIIIHNVQYLSVFAFLGLNYHTNIHNIFVIPKNIFIIKASFAAYNLIYHNIMC